MAVTASVDSARPFPDWAISRLIGGSHGRLTASTGADDGAVEPPMRGPEGRRTADDRDATLMYS